MEVFILVLMVLVALAILVSNLREKMGYSWDEEDLSYLEQRERGRWRHFSLSARTEE